MNKLLLTLTLLLVVHTCFARSDKKLVAACYDNYKAAILSDKAEMATVYLDSRTRSYYDQIAVLSKTADKNSIDTLPFMAKMFVVMIRHMVPREELVKMNGPELLSYSYKNGLIGDKAAIKESDIKNITVEDNFARAQCVNNGVKVNAYIHFYKEQEEWKIDITSLFKLTSYAFNTLIAQSGLTENDFIFRIAEASNGKRVDDNIWEPLAQK